MNNFYSQVRVKPTRDGRGVEAWLVSFITHLGEPSGRPYLYYSREQAVASAERLANGGLEGWGPGIPPLPIVFAEPDVAVYIERQEFRVPRPVALELQRLRYALAEANSKIVESSNRKPVVPARVWPVPGLGGGNPWRKDTWSPMMQSRIMASEPERAARLKAAAGCLEHTPPQAPA